MINHQHVYSTLRSALVDRDRDSQLTVDNAVVVTIGDSQFALHNAVPSGALLVAYSMLFRPGFMETAANSDQWWANGHYWLGADANPYFSVFSSEVVAGIAIAVGVYAGLINAMPTGAGVHLRPNFETPMVARTLELMRENNSTLADAKDIFIELMQDEQYRLTVPVADDFIANAFIAEWEIDVGSIDYKKLDGGEEING